MCNGVRISKSHNFLVECLMNDVIDGVPTIIVAATLSNRPENDDQRKNVMLP